MAPVRLADLVARGFAARRVRGSTRRLVDLPGDPERPDEESGDLPGDPGRPDEEWTVPEFEWPPATVDVGWVTATRGDEEAPGSGFEGTYRSWIYTVKYEATVDEPSLPTPEGIRFSGGVASGVAGVGRTRRGRFEGTWTTYMRIYLPDFAPTGEYGHLGVLLYFSGGTGLGAAVTHLPEHASHSARFAWLASGRDASGDPRLGYFRPGDPMVVVTTTYPGRGRVGLRASGNPNFGLDTPENATGQDYAGEMTMTALDAIWAVVQAIVEEIQPALPASIRGSPLRLIVHSHSWGLIPASRWIAGRPAGEVHALVDQEGPTDSAEQIGVTQALAYPDVDTVDYEIWAEWQVEGARDTSPEDPRDRSLPQFFWFRPPMEVAEAGLPESAKGILPVLGFGPVRPWWERWYDADSYDPATMSSQLVTFWEGREALHWLPDFASLHVAYIRMQFNPDHAQRSVRHAVKALNAAFDVGANPHVYYGGAGFIEAVDSPKDPELAEPDHMGAEFDLSDPEPWDEPGELFASDYYDKDKYYIHAIRWAMDTDFVWGLRGRPL